MIAYGVKDTGPVPAKIWLFCIFSFFTLECQNLRSRKEKIDIYLNDRSFIIKPGIMIKVETLVNDLRKLNKTQISHAVNDDIVVSYEKLQKFSFLQQILKFVQNSANTLIRN